MRSRNVRSPPLAGDQRRCALVLKGSFLVLPRTGSPGQLGPATTVSNAALKASTRHRWVSIKLRSAVELGRAADSRQRVRHLCFRRR